MYRRLSVMTGIAALVLSFVGTARAQEITLRYMLWEVSQLPAYEMCAAEFEAANPNININIEQLGWMDYWSTITVGFVTGDAPDVFVNHLSKYPEYVALEQLIDIEPLVVRDSVPTDLYLEGLTDLWIRDGARYGLPKDWDTVALIYNAEMLAAAGVDPAELNTLTWNPQDGGTFEQMVARLTLDVNGNNGLSADFDAQNVEQYGFLYLGSGGYSSGQTEWSAFAASTGWHHTNNEMWGSTYYYDDPRFIDSMAWYFGLSLDKGYAPPLADVYALGQLAMFKNQQGAILVDGSWMIRSYLESDFEVGFARLPIGPEGRKSMFNGTADSIWVGTEHPEAAWEWVKYLASAECQMMVAETRIVFPAVETATETVLTQWADAGVDVSAFTLQALEDGGTFLFPITDFGGEITTIMMEVMDGIALGQLDPTEALTAANAEINSLFD